MKLGLVAIAFLLSIPVYAETLYQRPPKAVQEILDAPATPALSVSPARTHAILSEPLRYPPIADLAAPVLRLAGVRINPKTNGPHREMYATRLTLKRISDGAGTAITLPAGAKPGNLRWESRR